MRQRPWALGQQQGNTLVTIDSVGATIDGNTFAGTTTRFATSLRARGPDTVITNNEFASQGLARPATCYVFIQNIDVDLSAVAADNTFDTLPLLFPDPAAVVGSICPGPNAPEHFACYKVDERTRLPKGILVDLEDQFTLELLVEVKKAVEICAPTDKNGEAVRNPFSHLVCYNVRSREVADADVSVTNQFTDDEGQELRVKGKIRRLCVPSLKTVLDVPPGDGDKDNDDD